MAARVVTLILLAAAVAYFVWSGREVPTAVPIVKPPAAAPVPTATPAPKSSSIPAAPGSPEPNLENAEVAERQRYYDGLVTRPPGELLTRFLKAASSDETTREILLQALTTALTDNDRDPTLTRQFADALLSADVPFYTKVMLARALAESVTLSGVTALVQASEDPSVSPELRLELHEAISSVGSQRRADGRFPVDLSHVLEAAFLRAAASPGGNEERLGATSEAIAGIGSENGVRVLLQYAGRVPEALKAAGRIRNPAAIPALLEPFRASAEINDPRFDAAGKGLVHIGGDAAVRPVLDWLANAPSDAQPLVASWFRNIREPVSYELVGTYLKSKQFRSPEVKAVLLRAYKINTGEKVK